MVSVHKFNYSVSLRIFCDLPNLDQLCRASGFEPKVLHLIGSQRLSLKGLPMEGSYPRSFCSIPIEIQPGEELSEFLLRKCDEFESNDHIFKEINLSGGRCEFFIGWYSVGNTGDVFSSELLSKIGRLGIDISLDVYGESRSSIGDEELGTL